MEIDRNEIFKLCADLALRIREVVRPHMGRAASRHIEGIGAGGDSTFSIDEVAETMMEECLKDHPQVAYYSEDRGLVAGPEARVILIVDPIDGTRPAAAGLEACCVSVAAAHYHPVDLPEPCMRDVFLGYICEIKGDGVFHAVRGEGAHWLKDGVEEEMILTPHADISTLFWTIGFRGRPAFPTILVLGELVDRSSVDGGLFDLGSATYGITRLLTGQLHAYVDVGDRMRREVAPVAEEFIRVGHGHTLNNSSYDLAAANLIAREAGLPVTDAYGRPDDDYPLLGGGTVNQLSCLISVGPELQQELIEMVDRGMERLEAHYGKR
jgi:myo-inositol-1(or 4)-monophosphatase